jgi:aspartate/methionine/tyrosine aminotransferase
MNPLRGSRYIHWAKTRRRVTFDLAVSGVKPYSADEPPFDDVRVEIHGPDGYGYAPLVRRLASKLHVSPDSVVHALGTSMSNHLAMTAVVKLGDEILIEKPAYEALLATAEYLGADVKRFERRAEDDFAVDVGAIEKAVSSRTRLIVLTNLHNPTSAFIDENTLKRIRDVARSVGARVLVDEVYLETLFDGAPRSAFHLGNEFVTTGSLTKAYGLSGLRCGWVVAEADLAQRIRRLQDLFDVIAPHAAEHLSVIALDNFSLITERAKKLLEGNRPLLHAFLDSRSDLRAPRFGYGTVLFPKVLGKSVSALCNLLEEKYDTGVVPGTFFEMPDHFRIGMGCDREVLAEGLHRLGAALDELKG